MKTNLKDTTFVIPIRIDSIVRLENLRLSVQYLLKEFDTNIIVLEASDYKNGIIEKILSNNIKYLFFEDKDTVFFRTRYLNIMTKQSTTPFVGIWDADVIVPKEQIIDAIDKLRQGCEISYPYDGHFYDTSNVIRELYIRNPNLKTLLKNKDKMELIYGSNMRGGAMFVNKDAYCKAGMENENFYGWGSEDWERLERWKILDYKIHCSEGPLFHLTHSRGSNSNFRSMEQMINANKELFLTKLSSKNEILDLQTFSGHKVKLLS